MWPFLRHLMGLDEPGDEWYAFWSGFGSDLTEFLVIGGLWKILNCHEPGCWRVAMHHHPNGLRVCREHHPN